MKKSVFLMANSEARVGINGTKRILTGLAFMASVLCVLPETKAAQAPVNLGAAGNFAILAKSGISTVPPSAVTGDMGVSPIDSTALTGFSLVLDGTTEFATSAQVTGKIYAASYAPPTPANLTTAVSDMETAFTDAAGRTLPDHTELGAGNIGGLTLAPGLYKWGTGVTIPADVTLAGGPEAVWIFQIAGNLDIASDKAVILSGGAQARNIFWQVTGGVGVDLGTRSRFEGIILAQKAINLQTGASITGRLLAQTAVTLDANTVTFPPAATIVSVTLVSSGEVGGQYTNASGHSVDSATRTITVPQSGSIQFYRIMTDTPVTIANVTISDGNAVLSYTY